MKKLVIICALTGLLLVIAGPATAGPSNYFIWNDWGGTYADAEKSPSNAEDDLMCWAAAASNILEWTGWGTVSGMSNADQIFGYFQDHWTDEAGMMEYGLEWWFDGTNNTQGWQGWSQVDAAGGGFYPSWDFSDYYHEAWAGSAALSVLDQYLHAGYGTTLAVYSQSFGHAVTVWGFSYDSEASDYYTGIYVTDSDDYKDSDSPPDMLRYYAINYSGGRWYLQDFYGYNNIHIGAVQALERDPGFSSNPAPGAILLGAIGTAIVGWLRRRKML